MTFLELTRNRISTRQYISKPVPRELIDSCLEAARMAPSACNSQPWSFVVIDDKEMKNRVVHETMTGLYKMNVFAEQAPVIIVAVREYSRYAARLAGTLRNVKYSLIDIGIACDHLTLQAEELGLGTCWLGWFNERKLKKLLNLPRSTKIDVVLSLGYPDPNSPKRDKQRKSLDEIRRFF
jgi:nitroreductase